MKPVKQTIFGLGGNCFVACVASILELSIKEVPNFIADPSSDYWYKFQNWLAARGYFAIEIQLAVNGQETLYMIPANVQVILSGKSPRGNMNHAILARMIAPRVGVWEWEFIHDPHPDNTFIVGRPELATFIVRQ